MSKTWVEISQQNLLHNVREITRSLSVSVRFMAVLKANAYGHDAALMARILLENRTSIAHELWFGVDSLEEALRLCQAVPAAQSVPILVLGYTPLSDLKRCPDNVRLTVYSPETIHALGQESTPYKIHLKIETGTQRQGIHPESLAKFLADIRRYPQLELEGISSHFAEAENTDTTFSKNQLRILETASTQLKELGWTGIRHIACSAAASQFKESHCDLVRIGINLYGLQSVNPKKTANALDLKPVLTWKTRVAQVKSVAKDISIGYGQSEPMPYDGQIAILPIGYWDGYPRHLSNKGIVLIEGHRCKIIGRVCMNMCMALLPKNTVAENPEAEVVLIGNQGTETITADELAQKADTINYELVTRINPLIPRHVVF